jgi:branched-chain amino acid transport system ATP-binding protein
LDVEDLVAGYGGRPVLKSVSIHLSAGEVVVLIGHNGAGKTTLLRSIFGLTHVTGGSVTFDGRPIANRAVSDNVADGVAFIPQGRGVFSDLSVAENLQIGGLGMDVKLRSERVAEMMALFPSLARLQRRLTGTLSGGEQQMVALARALMRRPRLVLVDEPSVGLAPGLAASVMTSLQSAARGSGAAILLAEQNVREAIRVSDRAYVLRLGAVHAEAPSGELLQRFDWRDLF